MDLILLIEKKEILTQDTRRQWLKPISKIWVPNELDVAVVGSKVDLTYEYEHLEDSTVILRVQGVRHPFYNLILFNRLSSYLPDAFYRLAKFKVVFEIQGVETGEYNRFLMDGAN